MVVRVVRGICYCKIIEYSVFEVVRVVRGFGGGGGGGGNRNRLMCEIWL